MTTQPTTAAVPPSNVNNTAANAAPPHTVATGTERVTPATVHQDPIQQRINALENLADFAGTVTHMALEAAVVELQTGKARDPAGMARNAATVKGIALDKRQKLVEEAPTRAPYRNPEQTIDALAQRLGITINPHPH